MGILHDLFLDCIIEISNKFVVWMGDRSEFLCEFDI